MRVCNAAVDITVGVLVSISILLWIWLLVRILTEKKRIHVLIAVRKNNYFEVA